MRDEFTRDPSLDTRLYSIAGADTITASTGNPMLEATRLIPHVHLDACVTAFKDNVIQCVISIMN